MFNFVACSICVNEIDYQIEEQSGELVIVLGVTSG